MDFPLSQCELIAIRQEMNQGTNSLIQRERGVFGRI